jgi:excisionase family DNA binding protein
MSGLTAESLMTSTEVAKLLGVSKWWVEERARHNEIPHIRLGRNVRYRRDSIERWISDEERGI